MELSGQLHARLLFPQGNPWYALDRSWVGLRAGLDAVTRRKKYPCLCRESNPVHLSRILVTILTELSRLLIKVNNNV
jgi:hypothetical protein